MDRPERPSTDSVDGVRLRMVDGDITSLEVDAIVNAANTRLAPGGGVCGAIHRAAGPELARACRDIGGCATGDAVATPGFALPASWVIHAVGPVWQGGHADEAELLASAYRRSIEVAREVGARTVAFPAISTGIYGYPKEEAAHVAVSTLRAQPEDAGEAWLVAFDDETASLYAAELERAG